jgi:hypothetical protein
MRSSAPATPTAASTSRPTNVVSCPPEPESVVPAGANSTTSRGSVVVGAAAGIAGIALVVVVVGAAVVVVGATVVVVGAAVVVVGAAVVVVSGGTVVVSGGTVVVSGGTVAGGRVVVDRGRLVVGVVGGCVGGDVGGVVVVAGGAVVVTGGGAVVVTGHGLPSGSTQSCAEAPDNGQLSAVKSSPPARSADRRRIAPGVPLPGALVTVEVSARDVPFFTGRHGMVRFAHNALRGGPGGPPRVASARWSGRSR